jgi:anti-sigma B factor antagonist
MTTIETDNVLLIDAPDELSAATAAEFRAESQAAVEPDHTQIDIDLRRTKFIDSSGLGALIALHKMVASRKGTVRLLNPQSQVLQILELTRLHRTFQITRA